MNAPAQPFARPRIQPDPFRLDGRVALVTAGAGHLGTAIVRALCELGAHVLVNGRNQDNLSLLCGELNGLGLSAEPCAFDVLDMKAARGALATHQRLDILINNAVSMQPGPLESVTQDAFDAAFASGAYAPFELMRIALPALERAVEATGQASIVNVASMYGHVAPDPRIYDSTPFNSPPHYAATKGALIQLTRYMACQWGAKGIRVNAVSPGPFPRNAIRTGHPDFAARLAARVPMGRVGEAHEAANAIAFLAGDAASFITGINLPVDGGWTAW